MGYKLQLVLVVIVAAVVIRLCVFTVDRTEYVYVTQLGQHVGTFDGSRDDQAGLHLRWPWPIQSLTRVDRRLQVLDLQAAELPTRDPKEPSTIDKTLAIDAYALWRIPSADKLERFILTVGTTERAREILRDRLRGRLRAAIVGKKFNDLISTDPGQVDRQREFLREELMQPVDASEDDGIELVDVRVRRLNYPIQVRQAIFDRIKSERTRKAEANMSRGRKEAANIKSESEAQVNTALDRANAENTRLRGAADSRADDILSDAITRDPDYYAELKKRELGVLALEGNKKVKVWSTELFRLLFPSLPAPEMKPPREGER
jgi:membrane protease subunit HflC